MSVTTYTCLACSSTFAGTSREMAEAGWFLSRGAQPSASSCPVHLPPWVKPWRAKKEEERRRREQRREEASRDEQTEDAYSAATHWRLKVIWPTAWDPRSEFFAAAAEQAHALGGGTVGGGIMTGAPLYNSPSNLTAYFTSEAEAFMFVDWLRTWFEPRKHDNCDVRLYELKLEAIHRYDL